VPLTDVSTGINRVMVIVAHPDDAESWAGGTVANFTRHGKSVAYVIVTSGDKGSADRRARPDALCAIRKEEQRNAARRLGVDDVAFLGYPDCEVEDTRCLRLDVTRQIRRFRPDLVIVQNPMRTHNLGVLHRDHRVVAGVALDCVYPLAGNYFAFPELLPHYPPHQVREVYVIRNEDPGLVIDISTTVDLKAEAFSCHVSQIGDANAAQASIRERSARFGSHYGVAFAEYFGRVAVPTSEVEQLHF
jgi:LmbE family N-acetylglucosaminyl deacetylase